MYVMMVSNGYPTERYPQNGIFAFDQAKAVKKHTDMDVILAVIDMRSFRNKRSYGVHYKTVQGVLVVELSIPVGAVSDAVYERIGSCGIGFLYKKIVKRFGKPSLIHAQFGNMGLIVESICRKHGLPLVITEHSSSLNHNHWTKKTIYKYTKLFSYADRVVAVGKSLKQHIEDYTGVSVTIVPNIVDLDCFGCNRDTKERKNFRFVSVGNLVELKNFDLLLEAFNRGFRMQKNVFLDIIGDGPLKQRLQKKIDTLGLGDRIILRGRLKRKDISNIYEDADAFILLSNTETFGVAYIEAMASGLPVIATKCGGPEDFVNNENGILVDVGDVEAANDAMIAMHKQIAKYDSLQISACVKEHYSAKAIGEEIYKIYIGVIQNGSKKKRSWDNN